MYKVFKDENFVVKGCKNFKLKSYIKSLISLGLINAEYQPDECKSGLDALVMAWKYYNVEKNQDDKQIHPN